MIWQVNSSRNSRGWLQSKNTIVNILIHKGIGCILPQLQIMPEIICIKKLVLVWRKPAEEYRGREIQQLSIRYARPCNLPVPI